MSYELLQADARHLSVADSTVDLIVTSPPRIVTGSAGNLCPQLHVPLTCANTDRRLRSTQSHTPGVHRLLGVSHGSCTATPQAESRWIPVFYRIGAQLKRHEPGCHPHSCLTRPRSHQRRAAMKATQAHKPPTIGDIIATWMGTADGCTCGNLQPPDACIPSIAPGMEYRCHYECAECGRTWTRAYPPTGKAVA